MEKAANEALDATISQSDVYDGKKGKFDCHEFPCQMKQQRWLDEVSFVCLFALHSLFE